MAESIRHGATSGTAGDRDATVGDEPAGNTGLTGGAEVTAPGADAGVTDGTRATATGANLDETEARGRDVVGGRSDH